MGTNAYIKTKDHLTISFENGETVTVYPSNPNYASIVAALAEKNYTKVRTLAVPVAAVQDKIAKVTKRGIKNVELKAGVVYYNGKAIHNTLTDRIVAMANEGFDIEPMTNFLANLQDNPSYRAVTELYGFLEKGKLPITEDGYFLAYKRVREDYTDCHTGKFSNAIGKVVEMARNQVNEDPKQTCSYGLHFCSRDYLQHFGTGGGRTVILKINPADVVAIPADYNDTKGRCCRYEVIGELEYKNEAKLEGAFKPSEKYQAPADEHDDEGTAESEYTIEAFDPTDGLVVEAFVDVKDAADWAQAPASAIRRVLKGERKSTAGYGWRYIDASKAHPDHLADLHEHGTLKSGQPHGIDLDLALDNEDEDDDEIPY